MASGLVRLLQDDAAVRHHRGLGADLARLRLTNALFRQREDDLVSSASLTEARAHDPALLDDVDSGVLGWLRTQHGVMRALQRHQRSVAQDPAGLFRVFCGAVLDG